MVDADPIYLQGENIVYIQPSDENDIPGIQIAGKNRRPIKFKNFVCSIFF